MITRRASKRKAAAEAAETKAEQTKAAPEPEPEPKKKKKEPAKKSSPSKAKQKPTTRKPKATPVPPERKRVASAPEALDEAVLLQIMDYGGFAVACKMVFVSKGVSKLALTKELLPPDLKSLLCRETATQGTVAHALHLKESVVRDQPYYPQRRHGGGEYHVFEVVPTVRTLLRQNGGLCGLQDRIDAKRLKQAKKEDKERQGRLNVEKNGTPPACRLSCWIWKNDAKKQFPDVPESALATMPTIPRPGSKAKNPQRGFWRADLRAAQRAAVLELQGVTPEVRATALAAAAREDGGEKEGPRLPPPWVLQYHRETEEGEKTKEYRGWQEPLSADEIEETKRDASRWIAAANAAKAFSGGAIHFAARKASVLEIAADPKAAAWLRRRIPTDLPADVASIAQLRDDAVKRKAASAFLGAIAWRRSVVEAGLRLVSGEALERLYPFLLGFDAANFAKALPVEWDVPRRVTHLAATAQERSEAVVLERAGVARGDIAAIAHAGKRRNAESLLARATKQVQRLELLTSRGGLDLDETVATLRSLVRDDADTRRGRLRRALQERGVTLRSDSSFCTSFVAGTTDASLDEVVATMRVTKDLFALGHRYWSTNASRLELYLRDQARRCGNWDDAYRRTRDSESDLIEEPSNDDYYDSDDSLGGYGGRRGECWSCGGPFPCHICGRY
mmetsp:Transcript_24201/g.78049  ORF Transcript_24201/g.78049 Transcript_24201/m.78049 type:complete len:678 (+) Transcript_24201:69-2102(+)